MKKSKTKSCQNCNSKFTIEPEDFKFYKKIDVPEPTFCPECRMRRRMAWRKEGPSFYQRRCKATKKDLVSIYNPNGPVKVYDQKYWFSDKWDPMDYEQKYDFEKTFLKQFKRLLHNVPQPATINDDAVRSDYCNDCNWIKGCYLLTNSGKAENLVFCNRTVTAKDCLDTFVNNKVELCYETTYCGNSYKLFFSDHCDNCVESWFLYDCRNCEHCFGCTNLRHKKYYIFNQSYSKENYYKKLKEFKLGSFKKVREKKEEFRKMCLKSIHRFAYIVKSTNSTGNEIVNSKNCQYCFDVQDCEDLKNVNWAGFGFPLKDSYDCGPGMAAIELAYEAINTGLGGVKNKFVHTSWRNHHIEYSYYCQNSEYLFGCVGLRFKQYCILNKQYTKEEFNKLVPKIKQHMDEMPYTDKQGNVYRYGEFFPAELSLFNYDETIAQEIFPLSKKEIEEQGYVNFQRLKNKHEITMKAEKLPDDIREVDNSILDEIIECANTESDQCLGSNAFRFIPQELKFYKNNRLPLPRFCPVCRHGKRTKSRNSMRLQKKQCMCGGKKDVTKTYTNQNIPHQSHKPSQSCPNTFQTAYSPNRPEIVYCEECYQREVE